MDQPLKTPPTEGQKNMYDFWFLAGFLALWLLLQMVILPRFGIRT